MSLNKVILIGNVGKDPEVRYFDSNAGQASFSLATSERGYTLANGTVIPERTEWHNIVVRREQVAFVEKWVRKGALMYVEGKIRTRNYEDSTGIRRHVTEIYADRVEFCCPPGARPDGNATAVRQPEQQTVQPPPSVLLQPSAYAAPPVPLPEIENDLPF